MHQPVNEPKGVFPCNVVAEESGQDSKYQVVEEVSSRVPEHHAGEQYQINPQILQYIPLLLITGEVNNKQRPDMSGVEHVIGSLAGNHQGGIGEFENVRLQLREDCEVEEHEPDHVEQENGDKLNDRGVYYPKDAERDEVEVYQKGV